MTPSTMVRPAPPHASRVPQGGQRQTILPSIRMDVRLSTFGSGAIEVRFNKPSPAALSSDVVQRKVGFEMDRCVLGALHQVAIAATAPGPTKGSVVHARIRCSS
jgi:hypothetical protein